MSPGTRLPAELGNATDPPSGEIDGLLDSWFPTEPSGSHADAVGDPGDPVSHIRVATKFGLSIHRAEERDQGTIGRDRGGGRESASSAVIEDKADVLGDPGFGVIDQACPRVTQQRIERNEAPVRRDDWSARWPRQLGTVADSYRFEKMGVSDEDVRVRFFIFPGQVVRQTRKGHVATVGRDRRNVRVSGRLQLRSGRHSQAPWHRCVGGERRR